MTVRFLLLFDNSGPGCVSLYAEGIQAVKLKVYQKLVVVVGWLGVSSKAGMLPGLQVPWSDIVGLTGGGAANTTRDDLLSLKVAAEYWLRPVLDSRKGIARASGTLHFLVSGKEKVVGIKAVTRYGQ